MIRFFRSPQPAVLFLIPLIAIALWVNGWSQVSVYAGTRLSPLWNMVVPVLQLSPSWLRMMVMVGVVSAGAIYFNLVLNRFEVLYKNSYLPAFFYALLSAALPEFIAVHPAHVINLILLFLLNALFDSYKQPRPVAGLFNAGFLVALCCLLYLPLLPLMLFSTIALPVLRNFSLRESLVLCIGIVVPFYLLAAWWFPVVLMDEISWLSRYLQHYRIQWDLTAPLQMKSLGALLSVIFLFAALRLRKHYYKNVIRTRLYQQIIFLLSVFLSVTAVFSAMWQVASVLLLIIPLAIFCTYFFVSARKYFWFYELTLFTLIAIVLWNRMALYM